MEKILVKQVVKDNIEHNYNVKIKLTRFGSKEIISIKCFDKAYGLCEIKEIRLFGNILRKKQILKNCDLFAKNRKFEKEFIYPTQGIKQKVILKDLQHHFYVCGISESYNFEHTNELNTLIENIESTLDFKN